MSIWLHFKCWLCIASVRMVVILKKNSPKVWLKKHIKYLISYHKNLSTSDGELSSLASARHIYIRQHCTVINTTRASSLFTGRCCIYIWSINIRSSSVSSKPVPGIEYRILMWRLRMRQPPHWEPQKTNSSSIFFQKLQTFIPRVWMKHVNI